MNLVKNAELNYHSYNKQGLVENLMNLIDLAMKVPDMSTLKYSFLCIGLCSDYCRNYNEALYAYARYRDISETTKDYLS